MIGFATADRILETQTMEIGLDRSRCLRSRYRKSTCSKCIAACVNQAVTLDDRKISRNPDQCKGCLLCVSSCPSDAFQWESGWHWNLVGTVQKQPQALIGCQKTLSMGNHAVIPCLGLISEEFVMALFFSIETPVYVDTTQCGTCENSHTLPAFERKLSRVSEKLGISVADRIRLLRDKSQTHDMQREVGRRKFFGELRNIIAPGSGRKRAPVAVPDTSSFSQKKQPVNSELLLFTVLQAPDNIRGRILDHYFYSMTIGSQCELCSKCAAMCPTGALKLKKAEGNKALQFRMFNCNGCKLCQEFCRQQAISLTKGIKKETIPISKIQSELSESSIKILNHNYKN